TKRYFFKKIMREHLSPLLLEQFKLECWINALDKLGIQIDGQYCNNLDIILSIIGFPPDNSREYDLDFDDPEQDIRDPTKKVIDRNWLCRHYLIEPYYELADQLSDQKEIVVSQKGLTLKNKMNDTGIDERIEQYINWLYKQYEEYKSV